jgi:hypothetical protein
MDYIEAWAHISVLPTKPIIASIVVAGWRVKPLLLSHCNTNVCRERVDLYKGMRDENCGLDPVPPYYPTVSYTQTYIYNICT